MLNWDKIDSENHFSVDEGNIEGELCRSGTLLRYYADLASEANSYSIKMKDRKDAVFAAACAATRIARDARGEKCTEAIVKEQAVLNEDYKLAQEDYYLAEQDAKKADLYFKSMKHKTDCLIAVSYHQRAIIRTDPGA